MQGDENWFQNRMGKATASRFKDIMATLKSGGISASRRNYAAQLVVERMTETVAESYKNTAMQWGTDNEDEARIRYEEKTSTLVEQVDFINHPTLKAGASPDGLVDDLGGCEIKCPYQTAVHIETLRKGAPKEHMAQIQGSMWIAEREWWDFVSFDPRMPEGLDLYVKRIYRDEKYIENLNLEVSEFLLEVEATINELEGMVE